MGPRYGLYIVPLARCKSSAFFRTKQNRMRLTPPPRICLNLYTKFHRNFDLKFYLICNLCPFFQYFARSVKVFFKPNFKAVTGKLQDQTLVWYYTLVWYLITKHYAHKTQKHITMSLNFQTPTRLINIYNKPA